MQLNKLRVLDLFSGIGGFSLGLESTGSFETIAFVEKDKFCQQVLQKNFPNIPIEDDVRNVKGNKYKPNVITGGFPCQPFSVAGKRRGTDDDRYLWDETIRIVSETKPKWFIGENVEGIVNIQNGMVFRQIHDDLESENYEVQSLVIPASGVGAWHQRKRVWIIGCNVSNTQRNKHKHTTIKQSRENKVWGFHTAEKKQTAHDIRSKTSRCNGISGKTESWWEAQSDILRNVNGVSYELDKNRSNRIKSLGNSIVPQIARELGKAIIEAEINI
jgi:DNA (cytosine-5)-methyltransferase 1